MKKSLFFNIISMLFSMTLMANGVSKKDCNELFYYIENNNQTQVVNLSIRFNKSLAKCHLNGDSPLHIFAMHSQDPGIFYSLLYLGKMDLVARNGFGESPLIVAMKYQNKIAANFLLSKEEVRKDINAVDNESHSALFWAEAYK